MVTSKWQQIQYDYLQNIFVIIDYWDMTLQDVGLLIQKLDKKEEATKKKKTKNNTEGKVTNKQQKPMHNNKEKEKKIKDVRNHKQINHASKVGKGTNRQGGKEYNIRRIREIRKKGDQWEERQWQAYKEKTNANKNTFESLINLDDDIQDKEDKTMITKKRANNEEWGNI